MFCTLKIDLCPIHGTYAFILQILTKLLYNRSQKESHGNISHLCCCLKKTQIEPEENPGQKFLGVKEDSRNSLTEVQWPPTDYIALIGQ